MGQQLYNTQPVFKNALDRCAEILELYLDKTLLEILFFNTVQTFRRNVSSTNKSTINETQYTQPALFAIEYALAQLWISWGIKPDYVMGHSIGEYVAAIIAGVFSLEDALKLVAARGRLMQALPSNGGMLAVFADLETVKEFIVNYDSDVSIAAINSPQNIVISGTKIALGEIQQDLTTAGINTTSLQVSHAFHSPLMQPMLAEFREVAETITYNYPTIDLVSNVTGELIKDNIATADYWVEHIIQPVQFARSFQYLLQQKVDICLEIGAKPILSSIGKSILNLEQFSYEPLLLPSLSDKQPNERVILNSLAQLYLQGIKINWQQFYRDNNYQTVKLPTYPFQKQRYWWEHNNLVTTQINKSQQLHPLLGNKLALADSKQIRFQGQINATNPKYLQDHCLETQTVFPATGYIEIALAAAQQIYSDSKLQLENFVIKQPLLLYDEAIDIQTVITKLEDRYCLQIFSNSSDNNNFILHSEVTVKTNSESSFESLDIEAAKTQLQPDSDITTHYQQLSNQGLNYGVNFQGIKQLWKGDNRVLGYIQIPDDITDDKYLLHPALLDSCLQLIGAATESKTGVYLPVSIVSLQLYKIPNNAVWAEVTIKPTEDKQIVTADLSLIDDAGNAIAFLQNLSLQYLSSSSLKKLINLPPEEKEDATGLINFRGDLERQPLMYRVSTGDNIYEISWELQSLDIQSNNREQLNNNWLIFSDNPELGHKLAYELEGIVVSTGNTFQQLDNNHYRVNPVNPGDVRQLWAKIKTDESWRIVYIQLNNCVGEFRGREAFPKDIMPLHGCAAILHLMQSISTAKLSQLMIVTQETQLNRANSLSGAIWGLGRTINLEYPNINCICLDLEATNIDERVSLIVKEIQHNNTETQIAYQNNQRYVARLAPKDNTLNNPFRLQLKEFGSIDNLTLTPIEITTPRSGEITIEVRASGVNFRDILNALGMLKEISARMGFATASDVPFGGECAGIVTAIGEGVTNFKVGDEVIAAQTEGSLGSHVNVSVKFVIIKPPQLTFTEAATIPTTFLTAYYGLNYLADIKPGDKILIHAAAGGVGQAALQLARQAGAEIYATASSGKWDFLKDCGVKHIMNSRNLDYADEIISLTGGKGVDIVLNSLNGDFIPKNLEILAEGGRFVEIGKVGIWSHQEVAAKRSDVNYYPFDLLEISQENPDLIETLLTQLRQQFVNQQLQPLPYKTFSITEVKNAFRYMAQAKHIGKVVIDVPHINSQVVKSDGSYLITGGLGALGLQVARWLVENGAKYLILLGRNQASAEAQSVIDELKQQGVTVEVVRADITDYDAVKSILKKRDSVANNHNCLPISPSPYLPIPVKGIIHAAGILDDGLMQNLTWERFQKVLQPKVIGTWNLHLATQHLDLDWFVCFSSVVSVFGAAGQSNYAVANAFMDNLMAYRRSLGLPGITVNWSIWNQGGMAQRLSEQQQQRLNQQGLTPIEPEQGLAVLKQVLQQNSQQTIVFPVDWTTFLAQQPHNPFFSYVQPQSTKPEATTSSFLQQLASIPQSGLTEAEALRVRHSCLQNHIRTQVAKVLGFSDVELIDTEEKFADLGMDSLMAVEFKNNLQASFGDVISLTTAFDYPTVELLTNYIAEKLLTDDVFVSIKIDTPQKTHQLKSQKLNNVGTFHEKSLQQKTSTKNKITNRKSIDIKPEYSQFNRTPEFINLKKDLERVAQLGNPFFHLHDGIAKNTIILQNRELINYSSYNYIGMSGDPIVTEAAQNAIALYGTSVSASRLLSGERPLHRELETAITNFIGTEDAIIYVGGHATNVSTIGHLFNDKDLIICDALSHNSIKEGCKLSGATIIDFPHNDVTALEQILIEKREQYQKVLITVEGIYSTDGDLAPVPEIVQLKQHYQTFLLVDEAHSIGVLGISGGGVREHFNLQPNDVDLWMGTLSKSFASCGGYIAGSAELIQYLKYTAPGFIFSVGMSPPNTAAALAAIELLQAEPQRAIKLQSRAKYCLNVARSKGLNTGYSADSPVIPIIVGEPHKAVTLSQKLISQGINVGPMVYPSVPYDSSRLRFFITCLHTEEQIDFTMDTVEKAIADI
jgi:myxalamid-type polyketide synthase MxaB